MKFRATITTPDGVSRPVEADAADMGAAMRSMLKPYVKGSRVSLPKTTQRATDRVREELAVRASSFPLIQGRAS